MHTYGLSGSTIAMQGRKTCQIKYTFPDIPVLLPLFLFKWTYNDMRAVLQRVSKAHVNVNDQCTGSIDHGLLILLGVHSDDTEKDLQWLVDKILNLRIFEDNEGRMNLSLLDVQGKLLVVSQFTLYGDCRKGRRPSWSSAAPPEKAKTMYEQFIEKCRQRHVTTETGVFQADMQVSLVNSGPVTMLLDSHKLF